jgi:hypothetical protein
MQQLRCAGDAKAMRDCLNEIRSKAGALLRRFGSDSRGNVAVITGIVAIPLFAATGIAVDYVRQVNARTFMQAEADAAALAAAVGGPAADDQSFVTSAKNNTQSRYGDAVENLSFQGKWINATDFSVEATAEMPVTIMAAVPGVAKEMDVKVISVARYSEPVLEYKPPTLAELDNDAADYNRLFVYCYDPKTKKRTQEVAVADNGGTKFTFTMPTCGTNENLSFRLYNVRNMRTTPSKWFNGNAERYNHYTDTTIVTANNKTTESYNLGGYSLVETVLCDTKNQCQPQCKKVSCTPAQKEGIIPVGTNRTPLKADATCTTGKFFYYGWEDRPPEKGGSDRDYNDIRVVIECPTTKSNGKNSVVLLR